MARDPISTGQQTQIIGHLAASFADTANNLAKNSSGVFDRFIDYQRNARKEKMQEEEFNLKQEATQTQIANEKSKNTLLNKQIDSFDEDKALQKRQAESEINARKSATALNAANTRSINQTTQEKEDLKKLQATAYNPLAENMKNNANNADLNALFNASLIPTSRQ
ncbi:hypothetical protein [Campylobacter cuniculorum]|uniref:Uncharacterized protein n=2 Tax=Campylobacter cuniculorum TaxID=374106 RepID=A0A1W6BUZ6_9BACT|nr:hypothetical protein [Campylobacter cuniculorum]ARJ55923.1 hypothetical protein CCUN_0268 [Campylobacter cuniculorum DSM 23162 = LMG 24588]QOR05141.1 hypothetical protein A0071_04210 [Campylobacter cuniculorum]